MQLEIIGVPQSIFVRAVRMACEEKKVDYVLSPTIPHTPEIDAIHPFGKIPVMRHGDVALFESKAIASYVDCVFPGPRLFPEDAVAYARTEQWVSLLNTTIVPVLQSYLAAYFFPKGPDGAPDRAAIDRLLPDVRTRVTVLDKAVAATGHLAGPGFSYADIAILPTLAYLVTLPEGGEFMAGARSLSDYLSTHAKRDSFVRTIPPPISELRR